MKSLVPQLSFKDTLAGALLLKAPVYAGLKCDRKAWVGSVLVVAAVALSHGFVVIAGALTGVGRFAVVLLVVMGAWRLAANYVAVREVVATSPVRAAAWLALGLVGGLGLMAAGTAMLNHISSS
jgi:hypothetical protein